MKPMVNPITEHEHFSNMLRMLDSFIEKGFLPGSYYRERRAALAAAIAAADWPACAAITMELKW